jgi:hypothetical protein
MSLKTEAVKLLAAEDAYQQAKGALDKAKREREEQRACCRPLLATNKTTMAGDIAITVTECKSAQSFRLAEFLREHKPTKAMLPFIGDGTPYERWTVKRAAA